MSERDDNRRRRRDEGGEDRARRRRQDEGAEGGERRRRRDTQPEVEAPPQADSPPRERRRRRDEQANGGEANGGGEERRRRRDEEGGGEERRRRRDEEGGGEGERRRRRDEEGGGGGEERRRRRDEEGGADGEKREGERRRRRDEGGDRERRPRSSSAAGTEAKEKMKEAADAEERAKRMEEKDEGRDRSRRGTERKGTVSQNAINLTYTAYSRQRRALDKYEKRCSFDQLLDKLHTDQFMELMGGKYGDRDEAKRGKEHAKSAEPFAKGCDPSSSSASLMAEFYTVLLTFGGVPVPPDLRRIVDEMEQRYKAEKRAEREKREEEERLAREAKEKEVEETQGGEGEEEEEYDDDFENIEDDVVDQATEAQNALINQRMNQENQEAKRHIKERGKERGSTPRATQSQGIVLAERRGMSHADTLMSNKRSAEWNQQNKRAQELLRFIPLDCVTFDMVEIQPITEYELYIRNFGASNTAQSSTQCPDSTEIESTPVQTDEITMSNQGAQAPDDLGLYTRANAPLPTAGKKGKVRVDTTKLSHFMANCSSVIRVLLDENTTQMEAAAGTPAKHKFSFAGRVTTLNTNAYVGSRGTTGLSFSRVALQYLITCHGKSHDEKSAKELPDSNTYLYDGLCIIWNINNPKTPDKVCVANGTVLSAAFSPHNGYLLYGGSSNGSVYMWDLREPDYVHARKEKKSSQREVLRMPTYSTDHMLVENHHCKIRRILPVGYNSIMIGGTETDSMEQVATLDEMGVVKIWIIVDVVDKRAFEKDFGLNVGGGLRLFCSATVAPPKGPSIDMIPVPSTCAINPNLDPFQEKESTPTQGRQKKNVQSVLGDGLDSVLPEVAAFDLEFQPDDASQFLIASDGGYVIHSSRFGDRAIPSRYKSCPRLASGPGTADAKFGIAVLSVHYSAVDSRLFVAGLADGSINVFKTGWGTPLLTLEGFTDYEIIVVRWSMMHHGVLWALDSNGEMFMFDLIDDNPERRIAPVLSQDCCVQAPDGKKSYPNDIDFSFDEREPKLAISYDSGRVDLHVLNDDLLANRTPDSRGQWLDSVL